MEMSVLRHKRPIENLDPFDLWTIAHIRVLGTGAVGVKGQCRWEISRGA